MKQKNQWFPSFFDARTDGIHVVPPYAKRWKSKKILEIERNHWKNVEMMPPGTLEWHKNAKMLHPGALEHRRNAEILFPGAQEYRKNTNILFPGALEYRKNAKV